MVQLLKDKDKDKSRKKEFNLDVERAVTQPSILAAVYIIGLVLEQFGFSNVAVTLLISFSPPFAFIFIAESLLNRDLDIKENLAVLLLFSFSSFILLDVSRILEGPTKSLIVFAQGLSVALLTMTVYRLFDYIIPFKSRRKRFFSVFLPTVILCGFLVVLIALRWEIILEVFGL